jgi:RES domain-containing protein
MFSGEGRRPASGRWHSKGLRIVYTAESRAFAALEMLVNVSSPRFLHA